jgi:hypothetical protein
MALVPAGFLVLVLLAALAVDSAVAYQAQSQLHDALAAAANDAVAAGVSDSAFYGSGKVVLDPGAVEAVVCQSIEAQGPSSLHGLRVSVALAGQSLRVTGSASVSAVFGRAVPGFGHRSVRSSADATLAAGAGGGGARVAAFGPAIPVSCP